MKKRSAAVSPTRRLVTRRAQKHDRPVFDEQYVTVQHPRPGFAFSRANELRDRGPKPFRLSAHGLRTTADRGLPLKVPKRVHFH